MTPRYRAMLAAPVFTAYLTSAARVLRRYRRGPRRYPGDALAICRAILDDCWTGEYLAASAGHFRQFWTRDLGFSAASLVRCGLRDRVEASLAWALEAWSRRRRVTTTIFPGRRPADVYTLGIDSLPLLLYALRVAGAEELVRRHGGWLRTELARYAAEVLDRRTGFVRTDRTFSTHRDTVRTRSNCYANTMVALLGQTLKTTAWFASPIPAGATDRLVDRFWRDDRFLDDPETRRLTGDAVVFPFWTGVVPETAGLRVALGALEAEGLTRPLPLRYAARRETRLEDPVQRLFVPNYQGTAIWTSLGAIYLALLWRVDAPAAELGIAGYQRVIERDGTLWEVLTDDLRPYRGRWRLYHADEAMLWSAIFLDLFLTRRSRPGHTG